MKKLSFIIAGMWVTTLLVSSQITLTFKTHGFRVGDSHNFLFLKNVSEGAAGENIIWDFSHLEKRPKTLTSNMLNTINAPKSDELSNVNFVLEEFGNYFYFNNQSNKMEQYATVAGNCLIKYTKPLLKLKFPLTYGNKFLGEYEGVQIAQNYETTIKGKYEIYADAYGTLILPENIVIDNVLRVKQTRVIEYSNGGNITEVTYRWYSADIRYPVFVIIQYVTQQQTYTAETAMYAQAGSHKKSATNVSIANSSASFDIYPNPFENELNLSFILAKSGKISIDLYNIDGKLIKSLYSNKNFSEGKHNLVLKANDLELQKGTYYIRIINGKESITRKIIKM